MPTRAPWAVRHPAARRGPVELIESLDVWETGFTKAPCRRVLPSRADLDVEEFSEELFVGPPGVTSLTSELRILAEDRGSLQLSTELLQNCSQRSLTHASSNNTSKSAAEDVSIS